MRRIDIFISSRKDVRKERALTERLIRSIAAEFNLPVSASYWNWLRAPRKGPKVAARRATRSLQEGTFLLCPRFWEYQDWSSDDTSRELLPNTGQYDLVICLLWSQLGLKPAPACLMPDGSEPRSATHYEIAWALDQVNRTPEFSALQIYRNRSTLATLSELGEQPEGALEQWDFLQEPYADGKKNTVLVEACHDYRDLAEFEVLFRKHFRDYIVTRLREDPFEADRQKPVRVNPFPGLHFFDCECAPFFYGRTNIVGKVIDILEQEAAASKPFVLLLGPRGSGKTSLVRAGILPVVTQVGTVDADGPWRHALTRPAAQGKDPFHALAAALLAESALPEFPGAATVNGPENLAVDLRDHPERAALLLRETLDHLRLKALNQLLREQVFESGVADGEGSVELKGQNKLGRVKPEVRLVLLVDQLEELFAGGISPEQQRRYLAALAALVRCQRFFVIAILRSDFYDSFLRSCDPDTFAVLSGRFELQPPRTHEIAEMIRLPSEAIGLRFEKDAKTGRSLDEAMLEAVTVSAEPLPLVGHLLSQLYQKQMPRDDGLLRWSDYREMGELEGALAHHAETAFLALDGYAQDTLAYVMRQLVSAGYGREGALIRRTILYRDLVAMPELYDQKADAKDLIDRFIEEGFFYAEAGPNLELYVTVTQEALLKSWPRVRQLLNVDMGLLRLRDRVEADLKIWLSRGRRSDDLLRSESGLSEAETLVRGFRTSLSDTQVVFLQKSLKAQKGRRRLRRTALLAVITGFTLAVALLAVKWLNAEIERQKAETRLAIQRDALQSQLKEAEARAQQNAELAAIQRDALQTRLKDTEASAQQAQQKAEQVASQRDALQAQLKDTEAKAQLAQGIPGLVAAQPYAGESGLSNRETAQKIADFGKSREKSDQSQPANAGMKPEQAASTQPLDSSADFNRTTDGR
jgi:energy-coupling factor transporter ATP-binding protein EcfA2